MSSLCGSADSASSDSASSSGDSFNADSASSDSASSSGDSFNADSASSSGDSFNADSASDSGDSFSESDILSDLTSQELLDSKLLYKSGITKLLEPKHKSYSPDNNAAAVLLEKISKNIDIYVCKNRFMNTNINPMSYFCFTYSPISNNNFFLIKNMDTLIQSILIEQSIIIKNMDTIFKEINYHKHESQLTVDGLSDITDEILVCLKNIKKIHVQGFVNTFPDFIKSPSFAYNKVSLILEGKMPLNTISTITDFLDQHPWPVKSNIFFTKIESYEIFFEKIQNRINLLEKNGDCQINRIKPSIKLNFKNNNNYNKLTTVEMFNFYNKKFTKHGILEKNIPIMKNYSSFNFIKNSFNFEQDNTNNINFKNYFNNNEGLKFLFKKGIILKEPIENQKIDLKREFHQDQNNSALKKMRLK
jgi:hypothetical protein